ncbi:NAD(P)/FAD-dependent oxidoreductase [Amycolatopsis oliviviridis]|uniref:NAD(P)/FAD-dependent oxidoreductase n=1 Tax=Amycolatopsis oliviviridis TaxID=1471590 RepID=UPI001E29D174|nr:FAD-dependent oxidoreductase [Amycolatopsis oliviviridis]
MRAAATAGISGVRTRSAPARADIAVLGGGIIGCLTAREVARRRPDASVLLIDRDLVGGGASLRSAGLHTPRGATPAVREMARFSQRYYTELVRRRPDLPIRPVAMRVVGTTDDEPRLRSDYLPEAGLTAAEDLPDGVRPPAGSVAWSVQGAQYADVAAVTRAVVADLRTEIEVREAVRVEAVSEDADGVGLRLGTGEELTAGRVVLAPGPWLGAPAWRSLVDPLAARVKRIVALHVGGRPGPADAAVIFEREDAFLLPLPGRGHWLFSYTCAEWDVDPDTPSPGLTGRHLDDAREILRRHAPGMAVDRLSGRVFCDAYSGTGEPLVRALGNGRIVFAGAANGSGYRLAPAIAARAADLLESGGS